MEINKFMMYFLGVFVLLLLAENTFGLGITPGSKEIYFEDGKGDSFELRVINNEKKNMTVELSLKGDLVEYFSLERESILFIPNENEKIFVVSYTFPDKSKIKPGNKQLQIIAKESESTKARGNSFVGAVLAVVSTVNIIIPHPGKYVEADLEIFKSKEGNSVKFVIPVKNLGTKYIKNTSAFLDIYSKESKINSFWTGEKDIMPGNERELVADWNAQNLSGKFFGRALIVYDENSFSIEKSFILGENSLELEDIFVKDFKLGGIAKFNIILRNGFEEEFNDLYAEFIIKDNQGRTVSNFKTATDKISPLGSSTLFGYWDTAGLGIGEYNILLKVYYGGLTLEKEIKAYVDFDNIKLNYTPTGYAVSGRWENKFSYLGIFVFLIIIVNIGAYLYIKWRKKVL